MGGAVSMTLAPTVDENDLHRLLDGIERLKVQHAGKEKQYVEEIAADRWVKVILRKRIEELSQEIEAKELVCERWRERYENLEEKVARLEERAEEQVR